MNVILNKRMKIKPHKSFEIKSFLLFIVVTLGFHFFFRFWASSGNYYPIKNLIHLIYQFLSETLYVQSSKVIGLIFEIGENNKDGQIIFNNGGAIGISSGCSGLKQMLQFIVLFVFVGGLSKHKIWFIPFGIFMMHLTNLFRIIGLSFFVIYWPEYWDFAHDYFFRPMFYVVIFGLWMWWVERFRHFA
jgi:exosortase/archaeosortase family protein